MDETDNPAARLHGFLDKAKNANTEQSDQTFQVWARVLEIQPSDDAQLLHALVQLHALIPEIKAAVEGISNLDHSLYTKPLPVVSEILDIKHLNFNWKDTRARLTGSLMTSLQFCAAELERHPRPRSIPADDLEQLQSDVEALSNQILEGDLDDALKRFLLQQVETVRAALLQYRLRGPAALREALEQITGAAFLNFNTVEEYRETAEVSMLYKIYIRLKDAVEFALKVKQLAEPIEKLFAALPPGSD